MNPNENNMNNKQPVQSQNNIVVNNNDDKANVEIPSQENHTGGVIGAIIIVIILVIGGLYYWGKQVNDSRSGINDTITAEEISSSPDAKTDALGNQGTSDIVADIEADLNATDLEGLEEELDAIDQELTI